MNAKEAREKASSVINKRDEEQYNKIKSEISVSVSQGSFSTSFYNEMYPNVKKKLEGEGFVIGKAFYERDGDVTHEISW